MFSTSSLRPGFAKDLIHASGYFNSGAVGDILLSNVQSLVDRQLAKVDVRSTYAHDRRCQKQ
jgi:hypothetical protein